MRIQIPIVVEMTDEQVQSYAREYELVDARAKTVSDDVRAHVLTGIQGVFDGFADVTIKR